VGPTLPADRSAARVAVKATLATIAAAAAHAHEHEHEHHAATAAPVVVEDVTVEDDVQDAVVVDDGQPAVEDQAPASPKLDVLAEFAGFQAQTEPDGPVEALELTPVPADLFEAPADDEADASDDEQDQTEQD
jgi:ribonuclease E